MRFFWGKRSISSGYCRMMSPQNIIVFSATRHLVMNLAQEIEVDRSPAPPLTELRRLALPQVPGFVAADVEIAAVEIREQLVVKGCEGISAFPMPRGEGKGPADDLSPWELPGLCDLGQRTQGRILQGNGEGDRTNSGSAPRSIPSSAQRVESFAMSSPVIAPNRARPVRTLNKRRYARYRAGIH